MVRKTRFGSYAVGKLPEGCRLCTLGAKLVLFVTGICDRRCFYCPLSPQRKGKDLVFANERPVERDEEILEEARLMDALGTGMTGGDPLRRPERTLRYLSMLKGEFGSDHHVHLYTAERRIGRPLLSSLAKAGLDEIRFHATPAYGPVLAKAAGVGLTVGVEIPSVPGKAAEMKRIALVADKAGCDFMNINELEMCESTAPAFQARGLRLIGDESMAVRGSLEDAIEAAEFCEDNTSLDVHVCPSRLKDAVQLRNRLGRLAHNVRKPYECIDEDNLLVRTILTPTVPQSHEVMERLAERLRKRLSLDEELLVYNPSRRRIETLPELAHEIAELVEERDLEVALTEEYPTWDRLETERDPINASPSKGSTETF